MKPFSNSRYAIVQIENKFSEVGIQPFNSDFGVQEELARREVIVPETMQVINCPALMR
jgi:hypothetical protein